MGFFWRVFCFDLLLCLFLFFFLGGWGGYVFFVWVFFSERFY